MPYTPPSSSPPQNPAAARPSPSVFGHGRHHSEPSIDTSRRPTKLHLSSSYLRRHRRSPTTSQRSTSEDGKVYSGAEQNGQAFINPGFWQIPHSGNTTSNHASTVPSPPDSRHNSSDEGVNDENMHRPKRSTFNSTASQKGLHVNSQCPKGRNADGLSSRFGLLTLGLNPSERGSQRLSKTSDALLLSGSADIAVQTPDHSDSEDDFKKKPPMVRKKSGELVRPALRCSTKQKSKSLPGTPTYSKAVHFGTQLEEVRHFLQLDRPLAVSANSSPTESYDGDTEFPFGLSDPPLRKQNFQWEARIANFPSNPEASRTKPVRLDRIFLSADNKYLVGVVVVKNLSFHKHVVARFTLDYWKTVSEVTAEYNDDIQLKEHAKDGYDTFNFNIALADNWNLDEKRMFICIRYDVGGMEFWDNNNSMNYHIDFTKKYKPKHGKSDSVPKSGSVSISAVPADFVADRLPKLSSSRDDIVPESPTRRPNNAFGNRYDFAASLTAAVPRQGSRPSSGPSAHARGQLDGALPLDSVNSHLEARAEVPRSDLISDQLHHQSPVYKELVDRYCFYGSAKPAADTQITSDAALGSSGALDDKVPTSNNPQDHSPSSSDSYSSSPSNSSPTDEKAPSLTSFNQRTQSPSRLEAESPRSVSPSVYNYSHHQSGDRAFLSESPTPTAILG